MHIGVIFHQYVGAPFLNLLQCNLELTYVINLAKFGVHRSQIWDLLSSQILVFCLYLRSRP